MTIACDFDGVIHAYSRGWADGTIYDEPLPGALDGLRTLMAEHAVFIFTTREPEQVTPWLEQHGVDVTIDELCGSCLGVGPATCLGCKGSGLLTFWNLRGQLLVTNRKLAATTYLDDRAVRFEDWESALDALKADEPPLSRYYRHEKCGFHWRGRDSLDIPMRDGQPICPRCELEHLTAPADHDPTTATNKPSKRRWFSRLLDSLTHSGPGYTPPTHTEQDAKARLATVHEECDAIETTGNPAECEAARRIRRAANRGR